MTHRYYVHSSINIKAWIPTPLHVYYMYLVLDTEKKRFTRWGGFVFFFKCECVTYPKKRGVLG